MFVFLDFEASALDEGSYPIEIGWVGEDGVCNSFLITPTPMWSRSRPWSRSSEKIHGIARAELAIDGVPAQEAAVRASRALGASGVTVVSDNPDWEERWLALLLAEGGVAPIAVKDVLEAHKHACRPLLRVLPPIESPSRADAEAWVIGTASSIIDAATRTVDNRPGTRHRAGADASRQWAIWQEIGAASVAAVTLRMSGERADDPAP